MVNVQQYQKSLLIFQKKKAGKNKTNKAFLPMKFPFYGVYKKVYLGMYTG